MSLDFLRNFFRVLQISPKHFKISQYKSYPVFWGTQLSCWVEFQIWSGTWWKTWSSAVEYYSLDRVAFKVCNSLCKIGWAKHHRAFVEVVEGPEISNFAYYSSVHFSSKFGRKAWSKWPKPNWTRPRNAPPRSRSPKRTATHRRRRTRMPRQARDHRSMHCTPRDVPPCHAKLPHAPVGPHLLLPAGPPPTRACRCRSLYRDLMG
jgi:hypothetical protein